MDEIPNKAVQNQAPRSDQLIKSPFQRSGDVHKAISDCRASLCLKQAVEVPADQPRQEFEEAPLLPSAHDHIVLPVGAQEKLQTGEVEDQRYALKLLCMPLIRNRL